MSNPPSLVTKEEIEETKNVVSEVAEDISKGIPPSNEKLTKVIESTKEVVEQQLKEQPMPPYGTRIVQDLQQVLGDTEQFLQEKNKGEKIQKIITEAKAVSESKKGMAIIIGEKVEKGKQEIETLQGDIETSADYMKTVAVQIVQSPEFRALLLEGLYLVQNSFQMLVKRKQPPITDVLKKEVEEGETRPLRHTMEETGEEIKEYAKEIATDIQEGKIPVDKKQRAKLQKKWEEFLRKISKNRDWHHASKGMLAIMNQFEDIFYTMQKETKEESKMIEKDDHIRQIWKESKLLLIEFGGEQRVNDFLNSLDRLYRGVREDKTSKNFFQKTRDYFHEILENPEHLDDLQYRKRANDLLNQAKNLSEKWKHKDLFNNLTTASQNLIEAIKNEPYSQKLTADTKKLGEHLLLDETGQPSLAVTQQAIQGLSILLFPVLSQLLKGFPIARLEGYNDTYDWAFDKLILMSPQTLLPEHLNLFFRSRVNVEVPTPTTSEATQRLASSTAISEAEIVLRVQGFEIFLNEVQFYFRRKQFPKLEDTGVMNVAVKGSSNFLEVVWYIGPKGLVVSNVRVIFDELNIKFLEAEHDIILPLMVNLFRGTIKDKLEHFVQDSLRQAMEKLNNQMNEAITQAQKSVPSAAKITLSVTQSTTATPPTC